MQEAFLRFLEAVGRQTMIVGDALSQLFNVLFLYGQNANENVSGRCWRLRHITGWKQARIVIDFVFSPLGPNHCMEAHERDKSRAAKTLRDG